MVADEIGFAGDNHGTTVLSPKGCALGCPAGDWQQLYQSKFIRALNSATETFAGISYTEIYSHTDEVVQPDSSPASCTTCLHTGGGQITNVPTQQLCPGDVYEHLAIGSIDPVAYALGIDALTHPGPADPSRIPSSVCSQAYMPGVNPANAGIELNVLEAAPGLGTTYPAGFASSATVGVPAITAEPDLPCYVYATCTGSQAPALTLFEATRPRAPKAGSRFRLHVLVTTDEGGASVPVAGVRVTFAGRRYTTDDDGDLSVLERLPARGSYVLHASLPGTDQALMRVAVGAS
jgi:hypothetical protein